jgi:hypothetical protein
MMDKLLYTQEDIDEWIRTCEELQERNRELKQEIAEYKDKIEQGTLIELPCKVGDTVYFVYETDNDEMRIDKGVIESFSIDCESLWFRARYESGLSYWHTALGLGVDVFLTREEAEKRLKELQE